MQALLEVIVPVFVVIGFGYLAAGMKWLSPQTIEGVMKFAQTFGVPCLVFGAISRLDLGQNFDWRLLGSFYIGAISGFTAGLLGARFLFRRSWEDAVSIGFCGLFSNSVLLGLPLTERAYGPDALEANFAIIAVHSPLCFAIGITSMELVRARGQAGFRLIGRVLKSMFSNALVLGVAMGLTVNLTGLPLPVPFTDGLAMIGRAGLPAALFALGGVLVTYRPEGDLRLVAYICCLSLLLHPAVTFGLTQVFSLPVEATRSAVITAAMAPGVNTYIFAVMYDRATRVVATSVLCATALSIFTVWMWLGLLP